jgi:hypothetical protein
LEIGDELDGLTGDPCYPQVGDHDPPQGVAGLPVTAGLGPVSDDFPDDAGIGVAARQRLAALRCSSGLSV